MLVIKIRTLGIVEDVALSNKQVLEYINDQDFGTRLEFAIGIDISSHDVKDQLIMLAAYTKKLIKQDLNIAEQNVLRAFLRNKLDELEKM